MSSASYQTIKLGRGRHRSPRDGACVMELVSMLAGEPFTDQPASVCPVIGGFLRGYNDLVGNDRRQDLYACAAKVVGSNDSLVVQRARAARLTAWALQMREQRRIWRSLPTRLRTIGVERQPPIDLVGINAVRLLPKVNDRTHAAALALIDELLAIGTPEQLSSSPASFERGPRAHVTA